MNTQKPRMLMPAVIGGVASGILTAIPFVSCFCCLWIIGGGFLAAYLLLKETPEGLTAGDGAIVGVFAGIIGAIVDTVVSIPFDAMMRNSEFMQAILDRVNEYAQDLPAGLEGLLEPGSFSLAWTLLGLVVSMVIFSAFSALGGIIGVSVFKKKPDPEKQVDKDVL